MGDRCVYQRGKKKGIKILYDISNEYCLWCKLDKSYYNFHEDLYIGFTYIPPAESSREKRLNTDHFRNLIDKYTEIESEHIILIGDFNARTKDYDDRIAEIDNQVFELESPILKQSKQIMRRNNQDKKANKYGRKLIDLCMATNSYIVNGRALGDVQGKVTCYQPGGTSTVDYAIVNETLLDYVETFMVSPPSISDHCSINLSLKVPKDNQRKTKNGSLKDPEPQVRWNDKTREIFLNLIEQPTTKNIIQEIDTILDSDENSCIDNAVSQLNDLYTLKGKLGRRKPGKKHRNKETKKWYDHTCFEMSKRLKLLGKLCSDNPKNPYLNGRMVTTRKEYRKLIKLKKSQWKDSMIKRLEEIEETNPKEYWNIVKELRNKRTDSSINDPEEFEQFFKKLFSKTEDSTEVNKKREVITKEVESILNTENNLVTEKDYTLKEITAAIAKLKNNKSGPVPAEMLKVSPPYIITTLLKLINKIKNKCYFPRIWANGITSLLHKDGDEDDPNNYRAITVASALAKVLTIMINERLMEKLENEKIITPNQIGFKKKARPADHLFVLKNIFQNYTNKGKKVYTCFVDFQKAYDNVWRTGMYYKLIKYGINIKTIKLIKDMYDKTSQTLKMNKKITEAFSTYKGVRQGCVMSPRLFNLFINDLPDIFDAECRPVKLGKSELSCLMFADDIVMMSESKEGLQTCLNKLEAYTKEWGMTVNKKKTKVMIIQTTGKMPTVDIKYEGQNLEQVSQYKYLGTIVSRTGNFKLNEIYLKGKGLRARYAITKSIGLNCKASTMIRIFQRMVEPILLYNCEVALACIPRPWTLEVFKEKMWKDREVDKVQKGFLRQILGINKKTTNMGILAETGKYPLSVNIYIQMMKYWVRLLTTDSSLLQEAHMDNMERYKEGHTSWIQTIIYLLKVTQSEPINIVEISQAKNSFIKLFSDKIRKLYVNHWMDEAATKKEGKLKFYLDLKKNFQYEKYLDMIPRDERKALTRLRLSSHSLPIEKMRYQKIARPERKCGLCQTNEPGDEWHYLTCCKNQKIEFTRSQFVDTVKNLQPQLVNFKIEDLMKYCLSMCDSSIQKQTADFINTLFCAYTDEDEANKTCETCCLM